MGKRKHEKYTASNKDRIWTIVLVGIALIGLAVLLYPSVSNWWNERVTTRAIADYDAAVAEMSENDYTAYLQAAEEYNRKLAETGSANTLADSAVVDEEYWELLDVSGTGIMGYVTIEKIDVQLPIYHGTQSSALQIGAGHLEGSSLPVGGESTHSVISAHRGLPSALLFTDLDQLEEGDTFTITVLNQVLTYEVDLISIILPDELENLYIEEGKDYCTLMTCTPYGVNSHRLLVRGVRVENDGESLIHVTADAFSIDTLTVAFAVAVKEQKIVIKNIKIQFGETTGKALWFRDRVSHAPHKQSMAGCFRTEEQKIITYRVETVQNCLYRWTAYAKRMDSPHRPVDG